VKKPDFNHADALKNLVCERLKVFIDDMALLVMRKA
jgi:hypothetical protein